VGDFYFGEININMEIDNWLNTSRLEAKCFVLFKTAFQWFAFGYPLKLSFDMRL
jgi:hypothetical protein